MSWDVLALDHHPGVNCGMFASWQPPFFTPSVHHPRRFCGPLAVLNVGFFILGLYNILLFRIKPFKWGETLNFGLIHDSRRNHPSSVWSKFFGANSNNTNMCPYGSFLSHWGAPNHSNYWISLVLELMVLGILHFWKPQKGDTTRTIIIKSTNKGDDNHQDTSCTLTNLLPCLVWAEVFSMSQPGAGSTETHQRRVSPPRKQFRSMISPRSIESSRGSTVWD